jgi:preprotein translocase subunit SecD
MKTLIYGLFISSLFLLGCSTNEQPDGWYLITDTKTMAPDKIPIVTASDFGALIIDSTRQSSISDVFPGQVVFQITGKIKADKVKNFADATEKAVGKQIGFLYNGDIISAPVVNNRIESGYFSITPSFMNDRKKMMQLYKDLKQEMR